MPHPITVIGAAILDVLASPAGPEVFDTGSQPMNDIKLSFGGDALNEAVVLSRLGKWVQLVSKVGDDEAGRQVLNYLRDNRVGTDAVRVEPGLATGINIVLIDREGERHFLTNPNSSLRRLSPEDIRPHLGKPSAAAAASGAESSRGPCSAEAAPVVSFASMFVSPLLPIRAMEELFRQIKEQGCTLFADMTKAKNGETLADLRELLPRIDVLAPNESEIALLTGDPDPRENVRRLLDAGVATAVVKCGTRGCLVGDASGITRVPAVPGIRSVDSTGAGDTFAAGYLAALSEGRGSLDCAAYACAAASCAVEQVGATEGVRSAEQVRERYLRAYGGAGR